jgi:hypothetical protein
MIFGHPLYTVILTYVPQHISRDLYNLELGVAAAGSRAKFLDYFDQIGIVSGHIAIVPTGICDACKFFVFITSKITEAETAVAVVDYNMSNTSL